MTPSEAAQFKQKTAAAAEVIRAAAAEPRFFIYFGNAFELDGFFDAEPRSLAIDDIEAPGIDGARPALLAGTVNSVAVIAAARPRLFSEGHGLLPCLLPAAAAHAAGADRQIFIDTAIGLTPELKSGKWSMLTDVINEFAFTPMDGLHSILPENEPDFAQLFDQAQNAELINAMAAFAETPRLGTFTGRPGYHACTRAEARKARQDGADLIGHDLVLQLLFSHALGCRVSALVLAGAQCLPESPAAHRITARDLSETSRFCSPQLIRTLRRVLPELSGALGGYAEACLPDADADELLAASIRRAASSRRSPLSSCLKRPN